MAQSIVLVLSQIRGGQALVKAEQGLEDIIEAVKSTGKVGELTLNIKVIPDKTDELIVRIKPKVKLSIPERDFAEGIFFIDGKKLSRQDPRQIELELERKANLEAQGATALDRVGRG